MTRILASLVFLSAFVTTQRAWAQADASGVTLTRSTRISTDAHPHVESYIATDPGNPRHLIATAMTISKTAGDPAVWTSFDGGATWIRGRFVGDSGVLADSDPIVAITRSGAAMFAILASVKGEERTAVARSADGGRTWHWTSMLPSVDREWMVSDRGDGPFGGRVYLTGTGAYRSPDGRQATGPFLARSDDDGRTFPLRTLVTRDRGGADVNTPINAIPNEPLVVGGLLLLTLQSADTAELTRLARDSLTARTIGLAVSEDGGDSFGPARYAPRSRVELTGTARGRRRLRAGAAFGNVRTAIDPSSSPFRNRIYFVAPDYDRELDRYIVRVWFTSDLGKSWGTAIASDAPRGDVANPAIAVNRDGVVAVTWNDRRDDPAGQCWRLYAAISTDGGEHFLPAARLSQGPTCVGEPANWVTKASAFNGEVRGEYLARFQTSATIPLRFSNGGDTQGLAADPSGAFHAAWIAGDSGLLRLWYTGFTVNRALTATLRPTSLPASSTSGMTDVTRDVEFTVLDTDLDFATRTYSITVALQNKSDRPLNAPLRVEMRHFLDPTRDNGLGLRNLAAANADSGGRGVGASWVFAADGATLAPGSRTKPRVLRFTFDGGVPEFVQGYFAPGFRVYATASPR
jgi:hypothetical protein